MTKVTIKGSPNLSRVAHSEELAEALRPAAEKVHAQVEKDPNEHYRSTIRFYKHHSRGRLGRVSWRIGVAPLIGLRVEAVRGTLRRALGLIK